MPPLNPFQRKLIALTLTQTCMLNSQAATITVNSIDDVSVNDEICTLREAVVSANTNPGTMASGCTSGTAGSDTIEFDPTVAGKTITLLSRLDITDDLIIDNSGQEAVEINGNNLVGLFGADYVEFGLTNLILSSGSTQEGGAIESNGVILSIEDSEIINNTTTHGGGALFLISGSTATIRNSVISGNIATAGAGLYADDTSEIAIYDSILSNNTASAGDGGALYFENGSSLQMANCTLSGNQALSDRGGAIFFGQDARASIVSSTLNNNIATEYGGAIFINSLGRSGVVTITNSTISGNSSNIGGGIAQKNNVQPTSIKNSTIAKNTAALSGGGISVQSFSTMALQNVVVTGNISGSNTGHEVYANDIANITSSGGSVLGNSADTFSAAFSNFALNATDINATQTDDGTSVHLPTPYSGIIDSLSDNGGLTATHAIVAGSPAIDAGDKSDCGTGLSISTDQRGVERTDGKCDSGAYEYVDDSSFLIIPIGNGKVAITPL